MRASNAGLAKSVPGAERFTTASGFTVLAAHWPAARLVAIWNSLPGATPITKFKDRKTAIARIWKAIQRLGEPVAAQTARKRNVAPAKAKPARKTTPPQPAHTGHGTRSGSKTAKILDLVQRPGGASLQEIMEATGWQAHSVRGVLSGTVGKKMGLPVVSTKTGDGERSYCIQA